MMFLLAFIHGAALNASIDVNSKSRKASRTRWCGLYLSSCEVYQRYRLGSVENRYRSLCLLSSDVNRSCGIEIDFSTFFETYRKTNLCYSNVFLYLVPGSVYVPSLFGWYFAYWFRHHRSRSRCRSVRFVAGHSSEQDRSTGETGSTRVSRVEGVGPNPMVSSPNCLSVSLFLCVHKRCKQVWVNGLPLIAIGVGVTI